jgi:hypothetical protein
MKTIQPASQWKPDTQGIFAGLSMEQYLTAPGASRSLLRRVAERPSTAFEKSESSDAQMWGTLLNDAVLFGTRDFYVRPDSYVSETPVRRARGGLAQGDSPKGESGEKPWNGNSTTCKQWLREHADKPVLRSHGDHSALWLERAEAAVMADKRVLEVLRGCQWKETSLFARSEDYHFLLKSRPDLLGFPDQPNLLHRRNTEDGQSSDCSRIDSCKTGLELVPGRVIYADIKTTVSGGTREFSREIQIWIPQAGRTRAADSAQAGVLAVRGIFHHYRKGRQAAGAGAEDRGAGAGQGRSGFG